MIVVMILMVLKCSLSDFVCLPNFVVDFVQWSYNGMYSSWLSWFYSAADDKEQLLSSGGFKD